MYVEQESIFYYLTVMNEQYAMPAMPEGAREGILKGLYKFKPAANRRRKLKAQLLGSGAIMNEVLAAQKLLEKYSVAADVWSVTSYQELYRDGHACERWNMLHPTETPRVPYVTQCLKDAPGVDRRGVRLPEDPAGLDRSLAAAAAARRSGPTASAAARTAPTCASSSRSTRGSSRWRRSPSWRDDGQIDRKVVAQAIKDFGIDTEKAESRPRRNQATDY